MSSPASILSGLRASSFSVSNGGSGVSPHVSSASAAAVIDLPPIAAADITAPVGQRLLGLRLQRYDSVQDAIRRFASGSAATA